VEGSITAWGFTYIHADAGLETGLADIAHLVRSFKAFFGITPGMVMNSMKAHFL